MFRQGCYAFVKLPASGGERSWLHGLVEMVSTSHKTSQVPDLETWLASSDVPQDAISKSGMDWVSFASMIAPFSSNKDLLNFAAADSEASKAFTKDEIWRLRLLSAHSRVLADVHCEGLDEVNSCCKLCCVLDSVEGSLPSLLRKPANALTGWELHEHRAWSDAVRRWLPLRRKQILMSHLGREGEDVEQVDKAILAEEAELRALQLVAQGLDRHAGQALTLSPEVRAALEKKLQQRVQARRQQMQWLQDDLMGPLLGPNAA